MSEISNTTRIAKNTLFLYFRQIIIMLVGLYTVRIKLNVLGIDNFGIYNIVGGVVVMFTFFNGAMTAATQRFLNFALGKEDTEQARNVYSISFIFYLFISLIIIILAETIGLWIFFKWLNIPPERHSAAFIVYQFSVLTTVIDFINTPYRSTIIAYEKMSFFALLSIIDVILKLGVVFLLSIILFDKLIVFAFLMTIVSIIIFLIHKLYCNKMFEIAHFRNCGDKQLFKQIAEYSVWSIFGPFASVLRNQGVNVLVNIFHGVSVNAAMGLANQVNSAVYTFVNNFQTAFRPQIIKLYAAKEYDSFNELILRTSKLSYYLLILFAIPLFFNTDYILLIWLKNVPEYTVIFVQSILIYSLIDAIAGPLWMSIQAKGEIKKYQIILSCFILVNLPLSFLFLWLGFNPVWVLIIRVIINAIILFWRILFSKIKVNLSVKRFLCEVIIPIIVITAITCLLNIYLQSFFSEWKKLLLSCIISTLCISFLIYFIGINKQEKILIKNWIQKKKNRVCL